MFTTNERRILNLLYVAQRRLTTKQVADKLEIAWQTAKDNLVSLNEKGYVVKIPKGNRTYWILRKAS